MSIASQQQRCPKCGGPIPPEAPQGLCPKCLLAEVSIPTDAGHSAKSAPPANEELAAAFPHLEILELIGQGGMGFVFKARQPKLDRFVALKILPQSLAADPAFAERFTREGQVLARLNHPNIVTIHDFGQANGFFYLLMEFVDGVNLRQAMRAGRFTPDQALAIVPKICEALQYAHNESILHRDIKPENILIDIKGRVKIADFGIAKLIGDVQSEAHLTGSGATLGTPHYMAPEQIEKPAAVDHRADIYSLGVVFYEMLTGELPLGRFAPPSERTSVDPRVDDVVMRTLEKQREKRFQSAGEMKTTVEHLTAGLRSESKVNGGFAWSRKAIWGAVLVGVSLPLELLFFVILQHVNYRPEINLALVFLFLVGAAGITGTVLGWTARHEIRKRPRELRGTELTAFAAFTYPGLVLCWIAFVILRNCVRHAVGIDLYPLMSGWVFIIFATGTIAFGVWAAFTATRQSVNKASSSLRGALTWVFVGMAGAFGCLLLMSVVRLAHQRQTEEGQPASEVAAAAITPEGTNTSQASAELWSPTLAPGETPDPQQILNEAHEFAGQLRYEEALQRHIWYHNHALEFRPSQAGVRLSFALSYWMELARRYPKAKQALIEIRDRGTREFTGGGGHFALFMEVSAINRELGEQNATVALFKSIQSQDPKLARQCYPTVEELLMEKGEYALCASFIPNFQASFENFCSIRERMLEIGDRSPEINQAALRKQAQQKFIKDTRKLVEILVGVRRKQEAEKIREHAVAILDVPELQAAVIDADQRVARFQAAGSALSGMRSTDSSDSAFLLAVERLTVNGIDRWAPDGTAPSTALQSALQHFQFPKEDKNFPQYVFTFLVKRPPDWTALSFWDGGLGDSSYLWRRYSIFETNAALGGVVFRLATSFGGLGPETTTCIIGLPIRPVRNLVEWKGNPFQQHTQEWTFREPVPKLIMGGEENAKRHGTGWLSTVTLDLPDEMHGPWHEYITATDNNGRDHRSDYSLFVDGDKNISIWMFTVPLTNIVSVRLQGFAEGDFRWWTFKDVRLKPSLTPIIP